MVNPCASSAALSSSFVLARAHLSPSLSSGRILIWAWPCVRSRGEEGMTQKCRAAGGTTDSTVPQAPELLYFLFIAKTQLEFGAVGWWLLSDWWLGQFFFQP